MKGFIEVTESRNNTVLIIAVRSIDIIQDKKLILSETSVLRVNETCEEIKALIEEAQKEDGVSIQYVPYYPLHPEAVPLPYVRPYPQTTQPVPLDFPTWKSKAEEEIT